MRNCGMRNIDAEWVSGLEVRVGFRVRVRVMVTAGLALASGLGFSFLQQYFAISTKIRNGYSVYIRIRVSG